MINAEIQAVGTLPDNSRGKIHFLAMSWYLVNPIPSKILIQFSPLFFLLKMII